MLGSRTRKKDFFFHATLRLVEKHAPFELVSSPQTRQIESVALFLPEGTLRQLRHSIVV
jgi:hypothetical protein